MTDEVEGALRRRVLRHEGPDAAWQDEALVVERPLYFVINGEPLMATMRTPGDDADLVAGYLVTEGVVDDPARLTILKNIRGPEVDTICVGVLGLDPGALERLRRVGASVTSCGVCGREGAAAFTPRARGPLRPLEVPTAQIPALLDAMGRRQPLFEATGGLHAAALVDEALEVVCVKEDIGRHNAIDKAAGWLLRQGMLDAAPLALISSGRGSFEVVQKAAMAGIGTVICVSAASSMAVRVAQALGVRLFGFARGRRAVRYWDPEWGAPEEPV